MVVDVCQYVHKVSRIAQDNPKQMALAAKVLAPKRQCEEFLARAKDQLYGIGQGYEEDEAYEQFNVVRTPQYDHHPREKGKAESIIPTTEAAPCMLQTKPHPSIYNKPAAGMVCSREELMSDLSIEEVEATYGTYYVPKVHPDSPDYALDSAIARNYSLWITTGDPQVLRKAYHEMAAVSRRERDRLLTCSGSGSVLPPSIWQNLLREPGQSDRWLQDSWQWRGWCWLPNGIK